MTKTTISLDWILDFFKKPINTGRIGGIRNQAVCRLMELCQCTCFWAMTVWWRHGRTSLFLGDQRLCLGQKRHDGCT